ncbi:MAG: hypothetical protein JNK48_26615 [Bryobacterales bacterium]|nr:hypothetical protein [Bryobacterales bacterium]
MKRAFFAILLTAAVALAQGGPRPGNGPGNGPGTGSGTGTGPIHTQAALNMAAAETITGAIAAIQIGYGMQYPSIVVNQKTIKVAPVWFLLENDMELKEGMEVKLTAAPGNPPNEAYLHAIDITALAASKTLKLRDAEGVPLWTGGAGTGTGNGTPQALGTGCVDPASIRTVSGTVESVSAAYGMQQPSMTFKTEAGIVTLKLGPERMLLGSDFEVKAGAAMTVKYGVATCSNENLALTLTNAAGKTLKLRNDDGTPAW